MNEAIRQTSLLSLQPSANQPRPQAGADGNAGFRDALEGSDRTGPRVHGENGDFSRFHGPLRSEFSSIETETHKAPGRSDGKDEDRSDLQPDQTALLATMSRTDPAPKPSEDGLSLTASVAEAPDAASSIVTDAEAASHEGRSTRHYESSIFLKTTLLASGRETAQGLPVPLRFEAGAKPVAKDQASDGGRNGRALPLNALDEPAGNGLDGTRVKDAIRQAAELTRQNPSTERGPVAAGKGQPQALPDAKPGEADGKVKVLSIQSMPAPAGGTSSALGSTGAALVDTIASDPAWRSSLAAAAPVLSHTAARAGDPLHSMKIQLHPAELGTVTAKLHMAGDQLAIELQVDSDEARQRLATDSDAMVKAMRGLGYEVDRITIQHSQPSAMVANPNGGTAGREHFSQPGTSQDGGGERSSGARQGRQEDGDGQGGARQQSQNVAGRNGLYI